MAKWVLSDLGETFEFDDAELSKNNIASLERAKNTRRDLDFVARIYHIPKLTIR
jgi:hypothetical protein